MKQCGGKRSATALAVVPASEKRCRSCALPPHSRPYRPPGLSFHAELRMEEVELPMKRLVPFLMVAVLGFAAGALLLAQRLASRQTRELEAQRAAWETEKSDLEAALASAQTR